MKKIKFTSVAAFAGIFLLAVVFNSCQPRLEFTNDYPVEILRINSDSTVITFAGQKYTKQVYSNIKQTGMARTEFYPDGSIKSFSKDGILVFQQDTNGNIGIGDGKHKSLLHIYSGSGSVRLMPFGFNPSQKLIIISDSTIHVEPKPIGNSKPMKRLHIPPKDS